MLFHTYIIVDWSAANTPRVGTDSVWYAVVHENGSEIQVENPPTRHSAHAQLEVILSNLVGKKKRVFLGFDFPFGLPHWIGQHLGRREQPWRAVWEVLSERMTDNEVNRNNRFEVASKLNEEISHGAYPFWGCPANRSNRNLKPNKHVPAGCEEYRLTEKAIQGPQSVFKLFGAGSVGSQALTGIPYLHKLRNNPRLMVHMRVWPFETGLTVPLYGAGDPLVVMAEVYPSIVSIPDNDVLVRDQLQVVELAKYFLRMDREGELRSLFGPAPQAIGPCRERILLSEGWIFGVEFEKAPNGG